MTCSPTLECSVTTWLDLEKSHGMVLQLASNSEPLLEKICTHQGSLSIINFSYYSIRTKTKERKTKRKIKSCQDFFPIITQLAYVGLQLQIKQHKCNSLLLPSSHKSELASGKSLPRDCNHFLISFW